MFALAILIGIYSYLIYSFGLVGFLTYINVFLLTLTFACSVLLVLVYYAQKNRFFYFKINNLGVALLVPLILLVVVNFFGVLTPETAFDALWYHLTIPKIFIIDQSIQYIQGGLFYYSLMPKLIDLLYIPALMFGSEIYAKFIHFLFGLFVLIALYNFSRRYLNTFFSLLVVSVFYANLVVSWQSTTAYIDLGRTFFELMSFIGIVEYFQTKKKIWLIESSIMMGFAISTKLISVYSLMIFVPIFFTLTESKIEALKKSVLFILISLLIPLPYFMQSILITGNPIYPFLSSQYPSDLSLTHLLPTRFIQDFLRQFLFSQDPINPFYLVVLPIIILNIKDILKKYKIIVLYSLFSVLAWYFTPRSGGGRFIMSYLPVMSLLVILAIYELKEKKIKIVLLLLCAFILFSTVGYRIAAQKEGFYYIVGKISEAEYLTKKLNFEFGDFYDTDGYFASRIEPDEKVLIYGIHNLYYVNFPFIHESYVKAGDEFDYVLLGKDTILPRRFADWELIYENPVTYVKLFSFGGGKWVY